MERESLNGRSISGPLVVSGSVTRNVLTLKVKEASAARKITYLREMNWNRDNLLLGANGIAALTFCDAPIEASSSK